MADEKKRPKGKNQASDKKRFIQGRINVKDINKDYLFVGKDGVYLDFTLQMLPDGELDGFENLGMLTQDVPYELRKKDKDLRGPILGNMRENEWEGSGSSEKAVGSTEGLQMGASGVEDDLPF